MKPRHLSFLPLALLGTSLFANNTVDLCHQDRGLVALRESAEQVWLSWRLFNTDGSQGFRIYRSEPNADWTLVGETPVNAPTWFRDTKAPLAADLKYEVRRVAANGEETVSPLSQFTLPAGRMLPYLSIPLQVPEPDLSDPTVMAPYTYEANDATVGDLDGDGRLEIILKWNPTNAQDNSRSGRTGNTLIDAYSMEGRRLWRINLGRNIRSGAHYTQMLVADFDGDGRAELMCKTSDGTIDGLGRILGDATADFRKENGHIVRGHEWLSVFNGPDGALMDTANYAPARHPTEAEPSVEALKAIWGDGKGNRSERYLGAVAYLDGKRPSAVFCRGYYTRATLAAWDYQGGKLKLRWLFDSDDGTPENAAYHGQGNHNLSVADVDTDGRDEIVYGSAVIDDDGKGKYSTGWGHADAMHVSDLVPSNPGLEVFNIQERADAQGMNMRDARTGRPIFLVPTLGGGEKDGPDKGEGPGRGVSFNIDPRYSGSECWATGAGMTGLYSAEGIRISDARPRSCNFAVWWDGDYNRELLDKNIVSKWNWRSSDETVLLKAEGCVSNNGTKATPCLSGDLLGDWREEILWRSEDSRELRLYTTTIPTQHRHTTLLEDRQYWLALLWQNTTYNQPPHPSFALEEAPPAE